LEKKKRKIRILEYWIAHCDCLQLILDYKMTMWTLHIIYTIIIITCLWFPLC